jgi:hypothetical protein
MTAVSEAMFSSEPWARSTVMRSVVCDVVEQPARRTLEARASAESVTLLRIGAVMVEKTSVADEGAAVLKAIRLGSSYRSGAES